MTDFNVPLNLVETVEDALELKRWLGERRPILAVDCETEGLFWSRDRLRLVQLGDANAGWAVPFDDWRRLIRDLLNSYDGLVVGHNLKFDQHSLRHYAGVEFKDSQCHDTRIGAHLLEPDKPTGLKRVAVQQIHPGANAGEVELEIAMNRGGWSWATVPVDLPQYWAYGALDTVLTARLWELQQPRLQERGLVELYELECVVAQVLLRMEAHGVRVDLPHCEREMARLERFALDTRKWMDETYGIQPTNQQVIKQLQAEGVQLTKRTRAGALALDEEVLKSLVVDHGPEGEPILHPLATATLNVRHSEKMANTYFDNFLTMHDGAGVLHPSVNQLGARTGRMSVSNPALQTLPRDDHVVRDAFVPGEGNVLLTADYEQIEMRIFASFCDEAEMIRKIKEGVDLHTITAQACYGLGEAAPTKRQRQIAKNANFCRVYGGGPRKFALTAGIGEAEAREFYDTYNQMFPGANDFMREIERVAVERLQTSGQAYVRTPAGRYQPLDEDRLYAGCNYVTQGSAADVFKTALVDMDRAGLGPYMCLPVHDEVLLEVPEDEVDEVRRVVLETMPDNVNWKVPLAVDVEGPFMRWGTKYREKE